MTILDFLTPKSWLNDRHGPRYSQLRKRLAEGVGSGLLAVGDTLPPEREIAAITGLSRVTVRKAIQALVEDGLIVQRQGSGSFVAPPASKIEQSLSRLTSFSEDMARRGMAATSVWLERGVLIPSPDEVFALGLAQDSAVSRIARLRMADGKPMAIERASLSTQILPNPHLVEGSLYAALGQIGLRPVRALQMVAPSNSPNLYIGGMPIILWPNSALRKNRVVQMTNIQTQMRREVLEIPAAVDRLLQNGGAEIRAAAEAMNARSPAFMVSVARGSSDHVATHLKYASELLMGVPIASIGPSIASIYKRQLHLSGSVCLSVSQSGKSPDIVEMARMARAGGALSIAITNNPDSPLAQIADHTLNLHAGPEISVAATKRFVNSAVAGIWLLAEWAQDEALRAAIHDLPSKLEQAVKIDWPAESSAPEGRNSIYCLGRGPAYAISNEAALMFKETCQIHAESYSSAEVLHGPVAIVDGGFPVIALAAADEAEAPLANVTDEIAAKGANVFATSALVKTAQALPVVRTGHALTDPITLIASFYAMVERTVTSRGINPDAPRHLKKITETV